MPDLLRSTARLTCILVLPGCAASGAGYDDVMLNAEPVREDVARIVLLRPRDSDDGSNGGAASIEIEGERVGALDYGGFLFADVKSSTTGLTAFGHYRSFGVCEIDIATTPGSIIYIDVGPRLSYMIAGAVGGAVGGIAGTAAMPNVYGSAGAAMATGTAGMAAGSAAGSAASTSFEGSGKRCRGPYKLVIIAAEDALRRLAELTWSKD